MWPLNRRLESKGYGAGFFRVLLRYGFMEEINVPVALSELKDSVRSAG